MTDSKATLPATIRALRFIQESSCDINTFMAEFKPIGPRLLNRLERNGLAYKYGPEYGLYLTDAGRRELENG